LFIIWRLVISKAAVKACQRGKTLVF